MSNVPSTGRITPTSIAVNEEAKLAGEGYGPNADTGTPAVLVKVHFTLGP